MAKPRASEVRWLLFEDNELRELKFGLSLILEEDDTVESDILLEEIEEEIVNREPHRQMNWSFRKE